MFLKSHDTAKTKSNGVISVKTLATQIKKVAKQDFPGDVESSRLLILFLLPSSVTAYISSHVHCRLLLLIYLNLMIGKQYENLEFSALFPGNNICADSFSMDF